MTKSTTTIQNSFAHRPLPHRDGYRMAPNLFVRSGMFSALTPRQDRECLGEEGDIQIPSLRGTEIVQYAGLLLGQSDFDTWLVLADEFALAEAEYGGVIESLEVQLNDLVEATEKTGGGKNKLNLVATLHHLDQARFAIYPNGFEDPIHFRPLELLELGDGHGVVAIPAMTRQLFDSGFTGINSIQRRALNPLGQWLHAHYSSHTCRPRAVGVEFIRRMSGRGARKVNLCGSRIARVSRSGQLATSFPSLLAKDLALLAQVTGWTCELRDGKVHVVKPYDGVGGNAACTQEDYEHEEDI